MPKVLHLFDVSPFVHAGKISNHSKLEQTVKIGTSWKTQVTPTGGTSLLFNKIYEICDSGDMVFCCDRNPTIKKDMLPTYKSNRNHETRVEVEKAAAEYILKQCGCTIIARAGYEADDIIYTLVQRLHDCYDKIYIYTGDSDLYFLVDDVVSIKPSSKRAKEVNMLNYAEVGSKKGYVYNTITVNKILNGDVSDCIPALPNDLKKRVKETLDRPPFYPKLGNKEFVSSWVEHEVPEAMYQVDLVFPLMVPDIPLEFEKPDFRSIVNFGAAINNPQYRGRAHKDFDIQPHILELQNNRGIYLEEDN